MPKQERRVISFTKVNLPYGWLGNMSPHWIFYEGWNYPTAEHLFQYMRFAPGNLSVRHSILESTNPMAAKFAARKFLDQRIVTPTSQQDLENMYVVLSLKVRQNNLREALIETDNARIIEDVTARQRGNALFWGAAFINGKWQGENTLGRLWENVRDELR